MRKFDQNKTMSFTIVAVEWPDALAVTIVELRGVRAARSFSNIYNVIRIPSPARKIICNKSMNRLY